MGDGPRVPALGEHRDGDDTADRSAESFRLADGVHDLAEQFLIGKILGLLAIAGALDLIPPEALDLVSCRGPEALVEGLARVELLTIDEQGPRTGEGVAVLVEVAEQRQAAVHQRGGAVLVLAVEAGDEVVDKLRGRRVVADDDEAGRHLDARVLPQLERLLVVPVERFECGLELDRQAEGVEPAGLAAPLLRHLRPDVLPQVPELRHLAARNVVGHRHPRQLDDAALDGVHQREVARRPGEQRPLRVARPAQEEGRRREVDHALEAELALHRLEPGDPDPRRLLVLLGLLAVVALQRALFVLAGRLLPVAVVSLVVQGEDALEAHQARHDALEHLPLGLLRPQLRPGALQQGAAPLRQLQPLARHERVVVGDDDLRPLEVAQHVAGHELAARVVGVGVVRLQHPQPVADRHAGSDHQEPAREPRAAGPADRVDGLPGDEHRHDRGLAGTGGELQGESGEPGVRLLARHLEVVKDLPLLAPEPGGNLGQPDEGLHRFDLTEERSDVAEVVAAPVPEEPRRLGRHPPRGRIGKLAPAVHSVADIADERRQVVLPGPGPERLRDPVEDDLPLDVLLLLRRRDRRDERDLPSLVDNPVRRLAACVELPVPPGTLVGRVQDRMLEESPVHGASGRAWEVSTVVPDRLLGMGIEPRTLTLPCTTARARSRA